MRLKVLVYIGFNSIGVGLLGYKDQENFGNILCSFDLLSLLESVHLLFLMSYMYLKALVIGFQKYK